MRSKSRLITSYLSILTLILIGFNSSTLKSQFLFQPYNLDFEVGIGGKYPAGWTMAEEYVEGGYVCFVNNDEETGNYTLNFFNLKSKDYSKNGAIFQSIDAFPYLGKTIEFSAKLKKVKKLDIDLIGFIYVEDFFSSENDQLKKDIQLTDNEWHEIKITKKINTESYKINLGIGSYGPDTLLFQNLSIKIVDEKELGSIDFEVDQVNVDKLNLIKEYYGLTKYFYPKELFDYVYHDEVFYNLINGLKNVDFSDFVDSQISTYFPQIKQLPIEGTSPNYNAFIIKHIGSPNFSAGNFSSSRIKNIYQSDRQKDAMIYQNLNLSEYGGKEFIFRAKVKYESFNTTGRAMLAFKTNTSNRQEERFFMENLPENTGDWMQLEIKSVLPENVLRATPGLIFVGEGKAFFDDVKIMIKVDDQFQEILTPNHSFEVEDNNLPRNWIINNTSFKVGYEIKITQDQYSAGSKSLMVLSDDRQKINYPLENTFTTIPTNLKSIKFPNVFRTKNDSLINRYNFDFANHKEINLSYKDLNSRLLIVMDLLNQKQHFYEKKSELDLELLSKIVNASKQKEFELLLISLLSDLEDSKANLWSQNDKLYGIGAQIKYLEGKAIISGVSENSKLRVGDEITSINGESIERLINKSITDVSGKNKIKKVEFYLNFLITSSDKENINLSIIRERLPKKVITTTDIKIGSEQIETYPDFMDLGDKVMYINAAKMDEKFLKSVFETASSDINAFIIDMRLSSNISEYMYSFFTDKVIEGNIFKLPVITKPNQPNPDYNYIETIIPPANQMLKGKIFLLIDHNTESYTENIVSVGVQNNLVTTVGTPTAGNQSELSLVRLPGFYNYSKAVMEVSDRKGNNLVGIQIQPDYLVEHKISDIGKNHDSQLKKAIELAKNLKK